MEPSDNTVRISSHWGVGLRDSYRRSDLRWDRMTSHAADPESTTESRMLSGSVAVRTIHGTSPEQVGTGVQFHFEDSLSGSEVSVSSASGSARRSNVIKCQNDSEAKPTFRIGEKDGEEFKDSSSHGPNDLAHLRGLGVMRTRLWQRGKMVPVPVFESSLAPRGPSRLVHRQSWRAPLEIARTIICGLRPHQGEGRGRREGLHRLPAGEVRGARWAERG